MASNSAEVIEKAAKESDATSNAGSESGESEYDSQCDYDIISMSSMEDLDNVLTEAEIKDFDEEVKNMHKTIKVVCGGPTGVGKSTLLNGLMGVDEYSDESASSGDEVSVLRFNVEHKLDHGTLCVIPKTFVKNDVEITLFDTPGLEGCNDVDDAYLQEIKEKCGDYDLIILCLPFLEIFFVSVNLITSCQCH